MAPELVFGSRYGIEIDWWCLGVLLYELKVKRLPFVGETVTEIHNSIMTEPPVFPSNVEPSLQKIISELLQKNSQKRLGPDFNLVKHHIYFR